MIIFDLLRSAPPSRRRKPPPYGGGWWAGGITGIFVIATRPVGS